MLRAAALAFVTLSLRATVAAASGHVPTALGSPATMVAVGTAAAVLPSETGVLIDRRAYFVLGWSWQIPLTASFRHRIVTGVNWVPVSTEHRWGGRVGYRFVVSDFIAGGGVAFDRAAVTWSPELGIKLPPNRHGEEQFDPSLHVIVRGDLALELNRLRAMTVLCGWTFF
jgi:hypothetical protein